MMAFGGITTVKSHNDASVAVDEIHTVDHESADMGSSAATADGACDSHGPLVVSWHACHNYDPPVSNPAEHWAAIADGTPRATEDVGIFTRLPAPHDGAGATTRWKEVDPDETLEEEWERIDDGGGRFLAVQGPGVLLCVAGSWFAFASDAAATADDSPSVYAAGRISDSAWMVSMSTDATLEGQRMVFPRGAAGWVRLPGSTLPWPPKDTSMLVQ